MIAWLKNIFSPIQTQYQEGELEDIKRALEIPSVRELWMVSMVSKIKDSNIAIDSLLDKQDKDRLWETVAIERRTILRCLQMILDARDTLESEKEAQERQNRVMESYRGAAAPLDLRQSE
jgi:hypothetical protein